jgi:hypothetical protein
MANKVAGVLVLCPSYGPMPLQTVRTLLELQAEGAVILLTQALADVSLSRCILAGAAEKYLEADDTDFVFWLDSDVWGNADSVRKLGQFILDFERSSGVTPSMSGLYMSRHNKNRVAAHKLGAVDVVPVPGEDGPVHVPALCGMGAMMQTVDIFKKHCDESPRLFWPDREHTVPLVCGSRPITAMDLSKYFPVAGEFDILFWHGEDFDYCAREVDQGRPVFVAPVMFGHHASQELTPVGEVIFPGLVAPIAEPSAA